MQELNFPLDYLDDPHALYESLQPGSNTILLESADPLSKQNRMSLMGLHPALKVTVKDRTAYLRPLSGNGKALCNLALPDFPQAVYDEKNRTYAVYFERPPVNLDEDQRLKHPHPVDVLIRLQSLIKPLSKIFISGAIAFDFINTFETVPSYQNMPKTGDETDLCIIFFDMALIVDHEKGASTLNVCDFSPRNEFLGDLAFKAQELMDFIKDYKAPARNLNLKEPDYETVQKSHSDEEFSQIVRSLIEHIRQGDAFQVVPARTFKVKCTRPQDAYALLKKANPSPYMFYLNTDEFTLFGTSPEFALRYEKSLNEIYISPIAGTRPRALKSDGSLDKIIDSRVELELRTNQKELAEHIMLVDLARNDLSRIAVSGTTEVSRLLYVAKYQHVMHLVTDVKAKLREDLDALHAYLSVMNMGTLSGAPKIMAHDLIYRYEGKRRNFYGGTVVRLSADGSFDSCIVIRSALVENGYANVTAGCGITLNSNPIDECNETFFKAKAALSALLKVKED